jgi:serpin B
MRPLCLLPLLGLALIALPTTAKEDKPAPADVRLVAKGNNSFAVGMYHQLAKKEGNVFFSPFSISAALGMTSAGASGDTLKEMEKALCFPPQKVLHPAMGQLIRDFSGEGVKRPYELAVANRLYGQVGYRFNTDFLTLLGKHYGAGFQQVDFKKHTEKARQEINAWAQKQTRDKIKDVLPDGVLNTRTKLVLVNAIYFKGTWRYTFKDAATHAADFHLAADKKTKAKLMYQEGKFPLVQTPEADVLELPYKGEEASMVVILPKKKDGLPALEKALTPEKFNSLIEKLSAPRKVKVWLPKFKFTLASGLKKPLQEMGMKSAFGPSANLSGMDGSSMLYVQDVLHKAFVDVNEKGTEAAAVTVVVVGTKSKPPATPEFRADHPFLFVIRDRKTGTVLFMGRVSDPTKG